MKDLSLTLADPPSPPDQTYTTMGDLSLTLADHTLPDDDAPSMPIIIGAGRGTTGTHLMHEATCHMGYASIYYNLGCIPPPPPHGHATSNDEAPQDIIPETYQTAADLHTRLLNKVGRSARCVGNDGKCGSVLKFKNQTLSLLEAVITASKNDTIVALHDSPYPSLIPYIIKSVKVIHGTPPVILLSERDPVEYTNRRAQSHGGRDLMCKNSTSIDQNTLEGGAFDIIGCIDRALSGLSLEDASKIQLGDIFSTMKQIYNDKQEDGLDEIAKEIKEYQDAVRGKADFALDAFAREGRTKSEDLAAEIASKVGALQVGPVACDFVNHWRRTKIGSIGAQGR